MKTLRIYFFLLLSLVVHLTNGQQLTNYEKLSKEELWEHSINTPDSDEWKRIRLFISQKFPNTYEGDCAKLFIDELNGKNEGDIYKDLQQIIDKYPKPWWAIYRLRNYIKKDRLDYIEVKFKYLLDREPGYTDYKVFWVYTFDLHGINGYNDESKTLARVINTYASKADLDESYIFDFLRGLEAQYNSKEYEKAETFYKSALEKKAGKYHVEVWNRLLGLQINELKKGNTVESKFQLYEPLMQAIKPYIDSDNLKEKAFAVQGIAKIADLYFESKYYKEAVQLYETALSIYPTSSFIEHYTDALLNTYTRKKVMEVLEGWYEKMPHSAIWAAKLGRNGADMSIREKYYKKAIEEAVDINDQFKYAKSLSLNYPENEVDKAKKLLTPFLEIYKDKATVYDALYGLDYYANHITEARENLTKARDLRREAKSINESYYENQLKKIEVLDKTQQEIRKYNRENPFNQYWSTSFKNGYSLYINFPINSTLIPASDYEKLDQLLKVITEGNANEYVFSINGHTDNTGSYETNKRISLGRAQAVVDYLIKKGVPSYRLNVDGFGPARPIASNDNENSRAKNRRVEINLMNKLNMASLQAATATDQEYTSFSKDGKLKAVGFNGLQVWDVNKNIKLKEMNGFFRERAMSPNSKYLAAIQEIGSDLHRLVIFDLTASTIIAQTPTAIYGNQSDIRAISWCTDNRQIAVKLGAELKIFDIDKQLFTNSINESGITKMLWTANQKFIVTLSPYNNGVARVYDAENLTLVKELDDLRWPHGLAANFDGKYIIVGDDDRTLHVYNTETWDVQTMKVNAWPHYLYAHPLKNQLLVHDSYDDKNKSVLELVNLDRMEIVKTRQLEGFNYLGERMGFIDGGSKIYAPQKSDGSVEPKIEVLNSTTLEPIAEVKSNSPLLKTIFADKQGSQLISLDNESLNVWDITNGAKVHQWKNSLSKIHPLDTTYTTFIGLETSERSQKSVFYHFNVANYTQKQLFSFSKKVAYWDIKNNKLYVVLLDFPAKNAGGWDTRGDAEGELEVFDLSTSSKFQSIKVPMTTAAISLSLYKTWIQDLDISPDNKKVALVSAWVDGFRRGSTYSQQLRIYDINSGKLAIDWPMRYDLTQVDFKGNDTIVLNKSYHYLLSSKQNVLNQNYRSLQHTISEKQQSNLTVSFPANNLRIEANPNNLIRFISQNSDRQVLTLASKYNNEWIAYTPEGEFTASANGTSNVYWLLGENVLPLESVKARYERPNLIKRQLQLVLQKQESSVAEKKIDPDLFSIPFTLSVVGNESVRTEESTYEVTLKLKRLQVGTAWPVVRYEINGREWTNGSPVITANGDEQLIKQRLNLQSGQNEVKVYIDYKQGRFEEKIISIFKQASQAVISTTPSTASYARKNTQLWFFGVGVSDYSTKEYSLEYADKDVIELGKILKKQEGVLFDKVNMKVLTNAETSGKNIVIQMNEFLKMASSEDLVVIHFAGHGTLDNAQNLYFMPYDSQLDKPYTGMEINVLKRFLENRPINQKSLVLIDICHAGAVSTTFRQRGFKTLVSEELSKELMDGTGSIVFSATTGKESALENSGWGGGHGAFTFALLEGLKGSADIEAGNKDKYISVMELLSFVSRKVVELTQGNQHPTTQQITNLKDFPFYKY